MITDVQIRNAGKKGNGVFALKKFKKGEFIFRGTRGKLVKTKDLGKLTPLESKHLGEVDRDTFEIMRAPGVYLNHSCDPNAISHGVNSYARKNIKKGEEITTDYRTLGNFKNKWKCYCGAKQCKGWVICDFFTLPENLQKEYLPYTLKFIKEEYRRRHK